MKNESCSLASILNLRLAGMAILVCLNCSTAFSQRVSFKGKVSFDKSPQGDVTLKLIDINSKKEFAAQQLYNHNESNKSKEHQFLYWIVKDIQDLSLQKLGFELIINQSSKSETKLKNTLCSASLGEKYKEEDCHSVINVIVNKKGCRVEYPSLKTNLK